MQILEHMDMKGRFLLDTQDLKSEASQHHLRSAPPTTQTSNYLSVQSCGECELVFRCSRAVPCNQAVPRALGQAQYTPAQQQQCVQVQWDPMPQPRTAAPTLCRHLLLQPSSTAGNLATHFGRMGRYPQRAALLCCRTLRPRCERERFLFTRQLLCTCGHHLCFMCSIRVLISMCLQLDCMALAGPRNSDKDA
jgi:hypothetical protein